MTYRTEVEWLDLNWTQQQIEETIARSAHTKFPVCEGDIDNVVGLLSVKDYYEHIRQDRFQLQDILQKPIFVSEHMLVMNTLKIFQQKRKYLAFVVNEFGTVEGIITLHDIMETIVGDLPDMDEPLEPEVFLREDGSFLVSGSVLIRYLNQSLGIDLIPEAPEHYSTLGGYVLYRLATIPKIGAKFYLDDYRFEVLDMDGSRIDKVLLNRTMPSDNEEATPSVAAL
jgi:putative hemolysin